MKKIIFVFAVVLLATSCGSESPKEENETEEQAIVTPEVLFEELVAIDQRLVKDDLSFDKVAARELMDVAKAFAAQYPDHEKTYEVIELAAKGAEGCGKYDEAINLLHRLITDFDDTDKTPSFMYNKARILEERLGKKDNAKAAYKALIERFPEDPLAISAQEYLNMDYINMSDAEIIEFLNSQNQE